MNAIKTIRYKAVSSFVVIFVVALPLWAQQDIEVGTTLVAQAGSATSKLHAALRASTVEMGGLKEMISTEPEYVRLQLASAVADHIRETAQSRSQRQAAIDALVMLLADTSEIVSARAKRDLLGLADTLASADFTQKSREVVLRQFRIATTRDSILLAGIVGTDDLLEEIRMQVAPVQAGEPDADRLFGTNAWAARLVLARRGDQESIGRVIQAAREQNIHTQVVFIMGELVYVGRLEVVDYIRFFLDSDGRLDPFDISIPGPRYSDYALAALSRMLQDFPVPFKEDYSYTEAELAVARKWMVEHPQWKFKLSDVK